MSKLLLCSFSLTNDETRPATPAGTASISCHIEMPQPEEDLQYHILRQTGLVMQQEQVAVPVMVISCYSSFRYSTFLL
ncbi:hypothetical protein K439DRAFT_297458 [Ramaria rubella]|nr:hypothetical protein K439DRAFT_297458 [Ramaria rubella]